MSLLSFRIFLEDIPDKAQKILGIVSELTPPPPARSPFTSTPKTMSSLRSRKSPSKGSLFVNTIVANRDTDERVFEADSLDNSPEKSGFQMPRKSKTSRERKIVCKDIQLFRDEDHEVRALGGPLLQAPINVSSACELEEISKPTSTATKHIRQASIYSHANSDISVDSGVSTETVRPRDFQHNSSSTVTAAHAHTSTTEEAKKVMAARIKKTQSSDGDQQQSSFEVLPSPYVMVKNGNGNGQMYFGSAKNSDISTDLEGATLTNTSSFESSAYWHSALLLSSQYGDLPAPPQSPPRLVIQEPLVHHMLRPLCPLQGLLLHSPPDMGSAVQQESFIRREGRGIEVGTGYSEMVDCCALLGFINLRRTPSRRNPSPRGCAFRSAVIMRTYDDTFSGEKIYPGKGKLYVRGDSKIFRFQNGKTESLFLQRKNPRRIAWTTLYRRQHKKGISEEIAKKRTRRTVKQQRGIVGAPLELIKDRRSQRPEAREAARKEAIAKGKAKKTESESKKKAEKAKSAAAGARGQPGRIQSKMGAKGTVNKVSAKSR
ncbi:MAG: hypothetical protein Q9164_002991 [Protoblastenia rupestris]